MSSATDAIGAAPDYLTQLQNAGQAPAPAQLPQSSAQPAAAPLQSGVPAALANYQKEIAAKQADLQPSQNALQQTINSPHPAIPQQQKAAPAPEAEQFQKDQTAYINAMAIFSGLVGAVSRGHGTAALSSFAAGVKGLQQGNQQAFDNAYKTWEANNKAALENNKMVMDEYKAIMDDRALNENEQLMQMKMVAAKHDDNLMLASENYQQATAIAMSKEKAGYELGLYSKKLEMQHEIWEEKERKKQETKNTPSLTPDAADFAAEAYLKEGRSALTAYGRGDKATANLTLIHDLAAKKAKERGIVGGDMAKIEADFAGLRSEESAIGRRAGTTEVGVGEFDQLIEPTRASIHKLDLGEFKDWNAFVSSYDSHTNDPDYIEVLNNIQELQNAYTSVLTRGGVRSDAAQSLSEKTINTLFGSKGSDRALDTMSANTKRIMAGINNAKAGTVGASPVGGVAPKGNGPSVGIIEDGYKFKGGDPADQSAWEKVQ